MFRNLLLVSMVMVESVASAQLAGVVPPPVGQYEASIASMAAYTVGLQAEVASVNSTLQLPAYDHSGPVGETLDSIAADMAGTVGAAIREKLLGQSDWESGNAAFRIGQFQPSIVAYTSAWQHWCNSVRLYGEAESDRRLICDVVAALALIDQPIAPIPIVPVLSPWANRQP